MSKIIFIVLCFERIAHHLVQEFGPYKNASVGDGSSKRIATASVE